MQTKPKVTIKNFAGMEDTGVFWCEGMAVKKINNETVLRPEWASTNILSEDTSSSWTNLNIINGLTSISFSSSVGSSYPGMCLAITTSRIFIFHPTLYDNDTGKQGEVHYITPAGDVICSDYPDIITTTQSNVLYSSAHHLGVAYRGQCKTGSDTTKIIDTAGRDLSGVTKVYNLTQKELHTVTSVTTTNATNDTLNFTASGDNNATNWFLAFHDDKFSFDSVGLQFPEQQASNLWKRQIRLWGSTYYILNGNYLAALSIDETTWTSDVLSENSKQLPTNTQALCFDINQDRMLLAGDCSGRGKLMLWDGYSTNWTNIITLDMPPTAIVNYLSGWLYIMGNSIYYTDGYNIKYITRIPDSRITNYVGNYFNCMKVIDDKLFVSITSSASGRMLGGLYIYDFNYGWTYVPSQSTQRYEAGGTVFSVVYNGLRKILTSSYDSGSTKNYNICLVTQSAPTETSVIFYLKFPQKIGLGMVELSLNAGNINYGTTGSVDVSVNYLPGNGLMGFSGLTSAGSKTIDVTNINQELLYNIPNFYGDSLYLEVAMSGSGIKPDLLNINLY